MQRTANFREIASVNRIYVKCPKTAPFTCPSCGKEHSWKKSDAMFDPNPQPS